MSRATQIKPSMWYTLSDLHKMAAFPWVSSFSSVRRVIEADANDKNILKANIAGEGRGKKYHIKGQNIISFLKKVGAGKATLS